MAVTDHTFLENQERFIIQPVLDFGLVSINLCGGFLIFDLNSTKFYFLEQLESKEGKCFHPIALLQCTSGFPLKKIYWDTRQKVGYSLNKGSG